VGGRVRRAHVEDHPLVRSIAGGRIIGIASQDGGLGLAQAEYGTRVVTAQDALVRAQV